MKHIRHSGTIGLRLEKSKLIILSFFLSVPQSRESVNKQGWFSINDVQLQISQNQLGGLMNPTGSPYVGENINTNNSINPSLSSQASS